MPHRPFSEAQRASAIYYAVHSDSLLQASAELGIAATTLRRWLRSPASLTRFTFPALSLRRPSLGSRTDIQRYELEALPALARVAFAARCSRKTLQFIDDTGPDALRVAILVLDEVEKAAAGSPLKPDLESALHSVLPWSPADNPGRSDFRRVQESSLYSRFFVHWTVPSVTSPWQLAKVRAAPLRRRSKGWEREQRRSELPSASTYGSFS